jgi:hypothetical protein
MTTELENKIAHLVGLCGDLLGQYGLEEIQSNKMATANMAEMGQVDLAVELNDLTDNLIECLILMD